MRPSGVDSAPYLAALVANSCSSRAKLVIAWPVIGASAPETAIRAPRDGSSS